MASNRTPRERLSRAGTFSCLAAARPRTTTHSVGHHFALTPTLPSHTYSLYLIHKNITTLHKPEGAGLFLTGCVLCCAVPWG
jgi:hypothetical protein